MARAAISSIVNEETDLINLNALYPFPPKAVMPPTKEEEREIETNLIMLHTLGWTEQQAEGRTSAVFLPFLSYFRMEEDLRRGGERITGKSLSIPRPRLLHPTISWMVWACGPAHASKFL